MVKVLVQGLRNILEIYVTMTISEEQKITRWLYLKLLNIVGKGLKKNQTGIAKFIVGALLKHL
jgi:hypothetical protein